MADSDEVIVEKKPEVTAGTVTKGEDKFTPKPYASLIGYFELDSMNLSSKEQEYLQTIWEYLEGEDTLPKKLLNLRNVESRMGAPQLGETRLARLFNYAKAHKAVKEAEEWRNSFLK